MESVSPGVYIHLGQCRVQTDLPSYFAEQKVRVDFRLFQGPFFPLSVSLANQLIELFLHSHLAEDLSLRAQKLKLLFSETKTLQLLNPLQHVLRLHPENEFSHNGPRIFMERYFGQDRMVVAHGFFGGKMLLKNGIEGLGSRFP